MRYLLLAAVLTIFSDAFADSGPNIVLAQHEEVTVTREDVDRYIKFRIPAGKQAATYASAENIQQVVQNIFVIRTLANQAKVKDESQLRWQAEFQRETWLAEAAQEQAVIAAVSKMDVEAQAREAYMAEPEKYRSAERVQAAHILLDTKTRTEKEALELAKTLRDRAIAGEDFTALAVEYSDDPSVERNKGELGAFTADRMVKAFSDVAFAMKEVGSISEPVKTEYGYHLIKLHQKLPAKTRSFESVKEHIIKSLRSAQAAKAREDLLLETRSITGVELNKSAIEQMVRN